MEPVGAGGEDDVEAGEPEGAGEDGGRMDAAYTFTTAGKLASADVLGTPAPGGELVARKVTYEYASPADPEAVSALRDNKGGALRSYDYDTVGSTVTRSSGGGTPEAFVYDGEDQLRRATRTGSGAGVEEYFYDHAGHRAAVVTRDAGGEVESVRVFFGDAEVVLSPTGWVTKAHAHLSLGTPVARITDRSELELQYHGLANSTLVSAAPTGDIQSGFVYGPYGEVLESVGPAVEDQHRRFNDKFQDDLTRLSYYGVRYYDNLLLGWTQADPMYRFVPDAAWDEPRRGLLYAFSGQNPLRYLDPDGRDREATAVGAENRLGWGCFSQSCAAIRQQSRDSAEAARATSQELAEFIQEIPLSFFEFFNSLCDGVECERRRYEERQRREGGDGGDASDDEQAALAMAGQGDGPPAGIRRAGRRGRKAEERVLKEKGLEKNTQPYDTSHGTTIPDAVTPKEIIEIKDTKRVTDSKQLRAQRELAKKQKKKHTVITGKKTASGSRSESAEDEEIADACPPRRRRQSPRIRLSTLGNCGHGAGNVRPWGESA